METSVLTLPIHHAEIVRIRALNLICFITLQWRHNERDGVSNHQPRDCLLNRLFRRRSKLTSKLRVNGLCAGNSPVTGEFSYKWPVKREMFPFDDVIINSEVWTICLCVGLGHETMVCAVCLSVFCWFLWLYHKMKLFTEYTDSAASIEIMH